MIITITNFKLPKPVTREEAKEIFLTTAPNYRGVEGLHQKCYIIPEGGDTVDSVGGVYLWDSREQAEAMFTESWTAFVTEKYQTAPSVTYLESPVMVDNVAGKIVS